MKIFRFVILSLIVCGSAAFFAGYPLADTIITNDGKEIKGIIVEDYKDRIVFSTADGETTIMKSDIRELSFDSEEDNLIKLAEQMSDRRDYPRAMSYYDMALKANPDSAAAKQGIASLHGALLRKEESRKAADIKRREDIELYGGAGVGRAGPNNRDDMVRKLDESTGMKIMISGSSPEIEAVKPGEPAYEAGLRKGDLLVSVWGKLTGYLSLEEILDLILNKSAIESSVTFERTFDVKVDSRKKMIFRSEDLIGVLFVMELEGLTISTVKEESPAIEAGLQKGDLVSAIDGKATRYMTLKKAISLIKKSRAGSVKLTIRRKVTIWRKGTMIQSAKIKFKRTKYFVSAKFQLKYVGLILLLMLVTALICSYFVYYTVMILMGEKLASVYPQGRLISIINMVNIRMMISLLLIAPVVAMIGIYLSHKIAGPIYRIESFLGEMAKGNFASRITLRKGDEFVPVADKINLLNDNLRATIGSQKSSMYKIVAELGELEKMVDSKPSDVSSLDKNIERLQSEIKDLERQLEKYKI